MKRRAIAKLLDFIAMGGFAAIGMTLTGVPLLGYALGATYLLVGDAFGSNMKSWFRFRVVDAKTGARCTLSQSVLRNVPWVITPGLRATFQSFDISDPSLRLLVAGAGIAISISMLRGFLKSGATWADGWAGTRVIDDTSPAARVRERIKSRDDESEPRVRTRGKEPIERDAVDFDDSDERPVRSPPRTRKTVVDREARDFDDAD